jgi:hypothetical protein
MSSGPIYTPGAKHGHTIEIMSRNIARAQALADQIGNGATVGTYGARTAGDIVIVAVLYAGDSAEAKERVAVFVESLDMRLSTPERSRWPTPSNGPASSWWAWHATAPASISPWAPRSPEDSRFSEIHTRRS